MSRGYLLLAGSATKNRIRKRYRSVEGYFKKGAQNPIQYVNRPRNDMPRKA